MNGVQTDPALLSWLLDSDPALRWQVQRDLAHAPPEVWQDARARIATEGYGARLLAAQDADGRWAGGSFFPARYLDSPPAEGAGQPWTATTPVLNLLREWGLEASALHGTARMLEKNARWEYDDLPYWGGEVDCCINADTLASGVWLGADVEGIARWFLEHRLPDGGWNCDWVEGSTRSSFHSTLNSVRGLLAYERATGGTEEIAAARRAGEEYLLERDLLKRLSTGELVRPWALQLSYPFRWYYDVLRAIDHFRAASLHDGTAPDERMAEAVEHVRAQRRSDGTWLQGRRHPGEMWFEVDVPEGEPSPWLTFYATRALAWWDTRNSDPGAR